MKFHQFLPEFFFLSIFQFLGLVSYSQSLAVIQKFEEEPSMDGSPFESAWDSIKTREFVMLNPICGNEPSQRSEAKIGYNDKYLYVAGYMYDTEPEKIRAKSKKRDEGNISNDFFGISLDTYNDNENAVMFTTTPAGLRTDAQIVNDGQAPITSGPMQLNWNSVWEVETSLNDKGWFAELRIPLSSLRYNLIDGKVAMGISFFRYVSRLAEWYTWPKTSNEWGFWSWAKPSQFQDVEINGIKSINPLYFSPYLLGGVEWQTSLNETETSYKSSTEWEKQIGMDAKVGLSKSLTLDLTVNTDFAQVEADDQQVNLTRFSLFFPEKRQFFLERSNIFDFKFGNTGQLFYSRRIGLYENQMVPIWGGGRLTGRAGLWDVGVMSLQTGYLKDDVTGEEILSSENSSVARLRRKIPINSNSYVGGLFTSKFDVRGKYNLSYGVDGIINIAKNDYINVAMASTTESDLSEGKDFSDLSKVFLQWERRSYKGLSYDLNYTRAGSSFNPVLGFEYRSDFSRYESKLSYGFIPGEKSKQLNQHQFSLDAYTYVRNVDNIAETVYLEPSYSFITKKNHNLSIGVPMSFENDIDTFYLSDDVYVPAGSFSFSELMLYYSSPSIDLGFLTSYLTTGKFYDGWIYSFNVSPSFTPGASWVLSLSYSLNDIKFKERDQKFLSHLFMFKALYMYSTKISASSFIQFNNQIDKVIWNARFRYNPKEGNDFYLVYNDYINTSRDDHMPVLPFSSLRTILVKYTHTFRIR